jgi:hypothetical protein
MRLPIEIAANGEPETQDKWRHVKFPFALSQPPQNRISSGRISCANPVCNSRHRTESRHHTERMAAA